MVEGIERPILYRARFLLPITAPPIEDGAIVVEHGCIYAVDTYSKLTAAYPDAAVIDFGEAVLLPPMVNAHTHLELSHFADWAAAAKLKTLQLPQTSQSSYALQASDVSQDFVDWILCLVQVKRNIGEAELQASLAAGLRKLLSAGTGAVGDILTTFSAVNAYRDSPLRGRIFAEVLGQDSSVVADRLAVIEALSLHPPEADLGWGLSPHAPYTLSSKTMNQVFAFAASRSLQCTIHLAESTAETDFMQNGTGMIADKLFAAVKWKPSVDEAPGCSPVSALCRQGRLRPGDLVVHGVQVDAADIEQLKQTGCSVVLCPRSNAALNVGKAPVAAYLDAGVPLALGTDSLASSPSLSIWDEMAFAMAWFAGEAEPRDWLEMATLGGAKALGIHDRMGQLATGYEASFQVVALAEMPVVDELEEALCTSGRDVKVAHLYLGGCQVDRL